MFKRIAHELRQHVPFTLFGALVGITIAILFARARLPTKASLVLFQIFHPLHVLLSAMVTTAMYRLHSKRGWIATLLVGYAGSVGIATLSDCIIPYLGELLLALPHSHAHIGFIEEWWLVNPLALAGIAIACWRPKTRIPHAGHVLLSTWASLFHITMAFGPDQFLDIWMLVLIAGFLFLAVWLPCCTSDIIFPLLFAKKQEGGEGAPHAHDAHAH